MAIPRTHIEYGIYASKEIYTYRINKVFENKMPYKGYRSVSLPKELLDEVRKIVEDKRYGYRSIAEFIVEAIRKRLEEIEKLEKGIK